MNEIAPKRRNLAKTQERIIEAAFDLFASQGYAKTSLRDIAVRAGVATSLVVRYFGTKSALFEKSLVASLYSEGFFVEEKRGFGEKMAQRLACATDTRITSAMVLSIADPESRDIAQAVTRDVVLKALADWLGPPDAKGRAFHLLTLMNGFMIQAHHLETEPVSSSAVARLGRSLQMILDEDAEMSS
jgi:AcrR family transcriptional regulator